METTYIKWLPSLNLYIGKWFLYTQEQLDQVDKWYKGYKEAKREPSFTEWLEIFPEAKDVVKGNLEKEQFDLNQELTGALHRAIGYSQRCASGDNGACICKDLVTDTVQEIKKRLKTISYHLSVFREPDRKMEKDDVQAIKSRLPMEDLVRAHGIKLNRIGNKWQGLCPFHKEKTPSFIVYPDGFHCFGCQKSGDHISFIMEIDNCDFQEALKKLK